MTLLNCKKLSILYRGKKLVNNINFSLNKNETLAIVGESGSGKSLLAKALLKLNNEEVFTYSNESEVSFLGQNIFHLHTKEIQKIRGKNIGLVFQDPFLSLNPVHDITWQIEELLLNHKIYTKSKARKIALDILAEVGLGDVLTRAKKIYPHQLSGGQRQRVNIALNIAAKPDILIADEPTTALDPDTEQEIILLLLSLQHKYHMSLIFITHNLKLVEQIADKILILKDGEVVETGESQKLFKDPQKKYSKQLLAAQNFDFKLQKYYKEVALNIDNLSLSYEQQKFLQKLHIPILNNISLKLHVGQTIGLIGKSGSGKTSLAKAILQFINYNGSVIIGDIDLKKLTKNQLRRQRRDMQIIFQDPFATLNPKMTIKESIKEVLHAHNLKNSDKLILGAIKQVGLNEDILNRFPNQFSGGQRQRISIARAIILKPKFLILDEPTASLDVTSQKEILTLLLNLQKKLKISYLFITHDIDILNSFAHEIYKICNKNLIKLG